MVTLYDGLLAQPSLLLRMPNPTPFPLPVHLFLSAMTAIDDDAPKRIVTGTAEVFLFPVSDDFLPLPHPPSTV